MRRGQVVVFAGFPPVLDGRAQWVIKRAAAVSGDPIPRDSVPALRSVPEQHVPAGQMRTLLASLLLAVGQSVPVDELAERLWPDRLPKRERAVVHTYVARLRRLLGHDLVETTPGGRYRLAVAAEQVDVWCFRD